jgi:hypothetical protein
VTPAPVALEMVLLPEALSICRLPPNAPLPSWFSDGGEGFRSMTRTDEELSLILPDRHVPEGVPAARSWRAFKVCGPLDFALTGIMARISTALANAGISLFAVSTYDTDYVLVRKEDVSAARRALAEVAAILP